MGTMASQITSLTIVYSAVYSDADQRKHQSSTSLAIAGNSPGTGEFPAQMASNAANVSIWWRHHGQVPSLVIGPLQSIYPYGYPSQLPGEYTAAHTQLGATVYKSALTGTHLILGREKQCSVKCLAQGHNKQTHRQGIEPGTDLDPNPESCTLPLDQLVATCDCSSPSDVSLADMGLPFAT